MARFFVRMPRLGETVNQGTIGRWLVDPGDRVAELDVIVEVATDKVDTELPAPVSGVVAEILAPEGAVVSVGERIAVIDQEPDGVERGS
jgi:2-oxoglutarate dehydrogenase E2 component (dihydrolipoamide succinyltransferase)